MNAPRVFVWLLLTTATLGSAAAGAEWRFESRTLAGDLKGGYQVVIADLNADGKPDIIALASGMSELVWFENPQWTRHVLAPGRAGLINLAAADTNGDGIPEIVLAEGFAMDPAKSSGIVSVLEHDGDPRRPWKVREIDRLATAHRIRAAKWRGQTVFVNAPLAGARAKAPEYREPIPLVMYRPPAWKRELISDKLRGVMHGIWIEDWRQDGHDAILTASFEGIHVFEAQSEGWRGVKLAGGSEAEWPRSGSSDVAVGRSASGERFLAALEPWHGNELAVYRERGGGEWKRSVIDRSFDDGHTLLTVDIDGDGRDEIIAGYRKGRAVAVYRYEDAGQAGSEGAWKRQVIDTSLDAAGCAAANLDAQPGPELVCIGSSTATLKLYRRRTAE
jgi:hypothetical protein